MNGQDRGGDGELTQNRRAAYPCTKRPWCAAPAQQTQGYGLSDKLFPGHGPSSPGIKAALVPIHQSAMDKMPEQTPPTILVVDDDDGVRKVLTRWVTEMGYAVFAAGDALTALDLMRQFPVDVALCDIRMPGHDGIWLIEQIGRIHPDVAIVLATGLVEMDPMVTLRPGVVGYVVKPFNRDELERVVKRGLSERKRLERECRRGSRMLAAALLEDLVVPTE